MREGVVWVAAGSGLARGGGLRGGEVGGWEFVFVGELGERLGHAWKMRMGQWKGQRGMVFFYCVAQ